MTHSQINQPKGCKNVRNKAVIVYLVMLIVLFKLWTFLYFGLDLNLIPNIWYADYILMFILGSITGIISLKINRGELLNRKKVTGNSTPE